MEKHRCSTCFSVFFRRPSDWRPGHTAAMSSRETGDSREAPSVTVKLAVLLGERGVRLLISNFIVVLKFVLLDACVSLNVDFFFFFLEIC